MPTNYNLIKFNEETNLWLYNYSDEKTQWTDSVSEAMFWEDEEAIRNEIMASIVAKGTPGGSTNPYPDDRPERP